MESLMVEAYGHIVDTVGQGRCRGITLCQSPEVNLNSLHLRHDSSVAFNNITYQHHSDIA